LKNLEVDQFFKMLSNVKNNRWIYTRLQELALDHFHWDDPKTFICLAKARSKEKKKGKVAALRFLWVEADTDNWDADEKTRRAIKAVIGGESLS